MVANETQRAYTAACPGCGAPVNFASLASTHVVCGFCQSTIVRDGEALKRIGKMAEVFEDYSALQLMAQGKINHVNFTVIGRLQYKYEGGSWNEWLAVLDDGTTASLSEDNGSFVWSRAIPQSEANASVLPAAQKWVVGSSATISGKAFSVGSVQEVSLMAAQGELPKLPPLGQKFFIVELRSALAEVLSIDYSTTPPSLALGRACDLEELQLTGLREVGNATGQGGKTLKARQFNCPQCGSTVEVQLAGSKSITCAACNSLIDLSQGMGGELRHALQDEPIKPLIPLGSTGTLQGKKWQVVGFQHRIGHEQGDEDEESFGWEEYLLYNAKAGFLFLVDSTEGWSIVKPTTGAPTARGSEAYAYLGTIYKLRSTYTAETSYVAGEFYWQVQRGQITKNRDLQNGQSLLSREQAGSEVTWSVGSRVDYSAVAAAFQLADKVGAFKREDANPFASEGVGVVGWIVILLFVLIFLFAITRCSRSCDPQTENCSSSSSSSGSRSSGGSYGGYSSGGGHK
ncbi:MAG: DUF4178 domain-containing protein [Burkholderiaceae bacterium]